MQNYYFFFIYFNGDLDDILIADSLFSGQQTIKLDSTYYNVNMNEGFEVRVDTTFDQTEEQINNY